MMDLPTELPLLVDDGFKASNALEVTDVPDVALFDGRGMLVIAKLKSPGQLVIVPGGNLAADELLRKVAAGAEVATVQRMFPYYPAAEMYGKCAPGFKLKKFGTGDEFTFSGKSPFKRPTMVLFWSSTCKHCQVEVPNLVKWLEQNPGKLDVVSVTSIRPDRPGEPSHRKITEAYLKSQRISWTVLEDPDHAVEELYGSISTPTAYFVTPDGTVTNAWFYAHESGFPEALAKELARANTPATAACQAPVHPPRPKMDFEVLGADGKRVPLASLVDRPSIVHFWATWCKPCVAELPGLIRFRDKLEKSGDARVILVSVEDDAAGPQIASFQKTLGADLRSYRAPKNGLASEVDLAYRVPRTYLLARGGAVLGARQGGLDWDDPLVEEKVRSRLTNAAP
jgi:thiol-disulfide isomerase/thioredoxin